MQGSIRSRHIYFVFMPGIDDCSVTSQVGQLRSLPNAN
jgi:hypothetical protein